MRRKVQRMGTQPHQVRVNALQLNNDDPDGLGTLRDIKSHQFLNRQAIGEVVPEVVEVVHPIGHDQGLLVGLGFHVLLNPGVQEPDIRDAVNNFLAVELEQQPQDTVRTGVLRSHVQQHGLAGEGAF